MKIGSIGNDDNPFLKKHLDEFNGSINSGQEIDPKKTDSANKINEAENIEGTSGINVIQNSKIDREQFTKEDDIQEIDLSEFEDDFK